MNERRIVSVDKNIVPLEPAPGAGFLFYGIKFLSFAQDKNLIPLPIMDKNMVPIHVSKEKQILGL
ncbi:hypothetical protein PRIO_3499 [Paenibacillus riograndensis SBR5]|uniref:Uncharacterized protein n=1 Tax=Paenibacillus riograndensis SBR5 TaxID=1073571 RepID=A0A0E4HAF1_9BACL|nr:hypothetical protein PRIO_3499 [Paenibacillus riograndensis SBR5]